jgi:hypothetical protein
MRSVQNADVQLMKSDRLTLHLFSLGSSKIGVQDADFRIPNIRLSGESTGTSLPTPEVMALLIVACVRGQHIKMA